MSQPSEAMTPADDLPTLNPYGPNAPIPRADGLPCNDALFDVQPYWSAKAVLAARADLEKEVERLKAKLDNVRYLELRVSELHEQAINKAEELAQRDERISERQMQLDHVDRELTKCEARVRELEKAVMVAPPPPEDEPLEQWRKEREKRIEAEVRVKELEEIANKTLQEFKIHTERDALRAQLDAIRKQPKVTMILATGREDGKKYEVVISDIDLISRPEIAP